MCWNSEVTIAMVAVGTVATGVTYARGEPAPIWIALGYFTLMEALQVAGYAVIDECGTPANKAVTLGSYLHIAFQPIIINLFALQLVPQQVRARVTTWVVGAAALSSALILLQLLPVEAFGDCMPGSPLCAERLCTRSGEWHIAWDVPYNGLFAPIDRALGTQGGFPAYMLAVFGLPLLYGAWRMVAMHLVLGPVLASILTDDPGEMPAIWCLFSIAILLVALSPLVRDTLTAKTWWGVRP